MEGASDMNYMQNRELSWLKFNERVLSEALDKDTPLLEKLKFISIFVNNLDEFFMVRVGSLTALTLHNELYLDAKTFLTPSEQIKFIYAESKRLCAKCDLIYSNVMEELVSKKVSSLTIDDLSRGEKMLVRKIFTNEFLPSIKVEFLGKDSSFPFIPHETHSYFRSLWFL